MPQLREIPLKPKQSSTPTTTIPQPSPAAMALPTPPVTPYIPTPRIPYPKAPSQESVFRNLIRGPTITLNISGDAFTLPIALLSHHSAYLREQITALITSGGKKRKPEADDVECAKKRKLEAGAEEKEARHEESGEQAKRPSIQEHEHEAGSKTISTRTPSAATAMPLVISLPNIDAEIFALFLTFMYKSAYTPTTDVLPPSAIQHYPCTNPSNTPSASPTHLAATFIPPSIHAYLLATRLGSASFLNHTLARIYAGIGVYYALSPTLMNFVWVQTRPGVPLRRMLLDVLIAHWPSQQVHVIARNDPAAWTMLFEAHQDLRQEFIMGLQGGVKVQAAQGYFVGMGEMMKVEG